MGDPLETSSSLAGGILRVTVRGAAHHEEGLKVFERSIAQAKSRGARGLLLDVRDVEGTVTVTQRFEFGSKVAGMLAALSAPLWLAIIGKGPTVDGFGTTVAQNRGASMELFSSEKPALAWLRQSLSR